mgnify:CR=1 FL=1
MGRDFSLSLDAGGGTTTGAEVNRAPKVVCVYLSIDISNRDLGLLAGLSVCVALLATAALSSTPTLPSGADPGNMLAESFAFGDASIDATYAPLLPWIMGHCRRLAPELAELSALLKGLGVALLFFQAACLGGLAWAALGMRAGALAYLLALAAPSGWTQLGWGGYGQFLGTGFGALALAGLTLRDEAGTDRSRLVASTIAGSALGMVTLSHIYSVPFFGTACFVLLARDRLRHPRELAAFGLAAVTVLLPGLDTLSRVARLGTELRAAGGDLADGLVPLLEGIQNVWFHPIPSVLGVAPMAVALAFKVSRDRMLVRSHWEPWIAGAVVLSLLTPMLQFDRIWLIATPAATLATAYGLASLPWRSGVLGGVAIWVLLATPAALIQNEGLFRDSGRLTVEEGHLLMRIPPGPILAVATETPSLEGYWFRGLTGRRAFIGDHYRWYASERERRESALVQNLLLGDYGLLGSPLSLIASTAEPAQATLVFDDGVERCPLFRLTVASGAARIRGSTGSLVIESRAETELVLEPVGGSRLLASRESSEGLELSWEYRYAPYRPRGLVRRVLVKGAALIKAEKGVRLRMSSRSTIEDFSRSQGSFRPEWTLSAIQREGAGRIVASRALVPQLQATFALFPIDSADRLTVFDIGPRRTDPPPDSLRLRAPPQTRMERPAR